MLKLYYVPESRTQLKTKENLVPTEAQNIFPVVLEHSLLSEQLVLRALRGCLCSGISNSSAILFGIIILPIYKSNELSCISWERSRNKQQEVSILKNP